MSLRATHIVGGELGYTCLGDNQYEIRLTIYRDCFFGNPDAYFDDPASIGVFDINNVLLQDIRVDLMGDDTLSPVLTDECLVIPPDVCVHTTTYRTVVELLPRPGGYQLAYQRCCRNQTIANIVDPLGTGATYGATISERALQECNSSAEFLQWPPLYICANEPIFFDQSAIDADGDSIVYRLCTPLQGADPMIPRPQPPNNPPYNEVVWNDPPYNLSNMLNGLPGGVPLSINSSTGLLTGVPNTVGQFVVGICAEEYRDGELISTTRRDFQYNVGVCGVTNAAFLAPELQCDGLEVAVVNQSVGTSNFLWIFGDIDSPLGTSTEPNPSFVFPDTGWYDISLIAAPGEPCADTFSQQIHLLPLSLEPNFSLDTLSCGDSLVLQINDLSIDELSSITSWNWTVNGDFFSSEPSPLLIINEEGDYTIELTLLAENGCQNAMVSTLTDVSFIQETLPGDSLLLCPGESVNLNPAFIPDYAYLWSPAATLDDPTLPNPLANPAETTTYELLLTDPTTGCMADRSIVVVVTEALTVDLSPDEITCAETVTLEASSNNGIRYFWSPFADFNSEVTEGETYTVSPLGAATYYLQVLNEAGCVVYDSVMVNSQAANISLLTPDTALCLGESFTINAFNDDPNDILTWTWEPADQILDGQGTASPMVQPAMAGEQTFTLSVTNQFGCDATDSLVLTAIDLSDFGAAIEYDQCSGYSVRFSSSDTGAGVYQWDFGDPANPGATGEGAQVNHIYASAGTYEVLVTLPAFLNCADTVSLIVELEEDGMINPDFAWEYESCADTANILLTDLTTATATTITQWEWLSEGITLGQMPNLELTIDSAQSIEVSLITTAENGCIDTVSQSIFINLISLSLPNELLLCPGDSVFLNPFGDEGYTYSWTPGLHLNDSTAVNPLAQPAMTTNYMVHVSDPNSICEQSGEVLVTVAPLMEYSLSPDTVTCAESWTLFAESEQAIDYIWSLNDDFTQVIGTSETQVVSPVAESYFYLQLTDELGCQILDSVMIDSRAIDVLIDQEVTICRGDTVDLNVLNLGPDPITGYSWAPAALIIDGQGTENAVVAPPSTTRFDIQLTNAFGCEADTSILVNVFLLLPPLSVTPEQDTLRPGESVQIMATDDPTYTYNWTPGLGLDASDIPNPVASPEETTNYHLRITDANGCSNEANVLLVVFNSPCTTPYIFVPNAFSPNGDNLNDVLKVEANVIDDFYLAIYNRWGEQVFESYSQEEGWDGTFEGKMLSPDVFGYYLEARCFNGEEFVAKGNISLLR